MVYIHTKFRENRSIDSEVERDVHTHRQHGKLISLLQARKIG